MDENIGGVSISVVGDFSDLEAAFQAAVSDAQSKGAQLAQAIQDSASAPNISPVTDAFGQIATSAEQAGKDVSAAMGIEIQPPDVSAVLDAFSSVASLATTSAQAASAAFADMTIPAADTSAVVESLQSLDASAAGAAQQISADFAEVTIQPPDTSAVVDGLNSIVGAAQQVSGALADVGTGESGFNAAMEQLIGEGQSANEAFQTLTGSAMSLMDAMKSGALTEFADAFGKVSAESAPAVGAVESLDNSIKAIGPDAEQAAGGVNDLATAGQNATTALTAVNPPLQQAQQNAAAASESFGSLNSALAFAGLSISIAGFVELGKAIGESIDNMTRANIALTNITGSAQQAADMLEKIDQLGLSDGLSIPGLQQAAISMANLLPAGTDVVGTLSLIANGAELMGTNIDAASKKFDLIAESGKASDKALSSLGLNLDKLKTAMEQTGANLAGFGDDAKKAFAALDVHDRIVVLQTALQDLGDTAKKVADDTFAGAWHKAAAQFDVDITLIQNDLGKVGVSFSALPQVVNGIAAAFVAAYTIVKGAVDGIIDLLTAAFQASVAAQTALDSAVSGQFTKAWQQLKDGMSTAGALVKQSWADVTTDISAGTKTITDLMNQGTTVIKAHIDTLGGAGKAAKTAADGIAAAAAAVNTFESQLSAGGSVKALQADFENASKAIGILAKADLPAAIKAVDDYAAAQLRNQAPASVMIQAFTEQSKLIGQLAKSDLPAAITAMQGVVQQYVDAKQPIGIVTAAFTDQEKLINQLAKTDLPAAEAAQEKLTQTMIDGNEPIGLITQSFTAQQKIIEQMAKEGLPGAADAMSKLAEQEKAVGEPGKVVTDTLLAEQKILQDLGKTDLPAAIKGMSDLVDEETKLNEPASVVQGTLAAEQKLIQDLGKTDLPAAIKAMGDLVDKELALKEPTQVVTDTFNAQEKLINSLAASDLPAAIKAMDDLAQKEKDANQPAQVIYKTLQDQQKLIQDLAKTDLPGAINKFEDLIQKEQDLNAPAAQIRDTMQQEEKAIMDLGQTALPTAIQAMQNFIDKQNAMKQPAQDIAKAFGDEQKLIQQLAQTDMPAAVAAQQQLIDKMNAMKQPTTDIETAFGNLSKLYQTMAKTDLPGAVSGFQQLIDKMQAAKIPASDMQSEMKAFEDSVTDLANRGLPGANQALEAYIAELKKVPPAFKDIEAQQEIQLAKDQDMLAMMQKAGDGYGYILDQQGKVLQEEINIAEKTGGDANQMVMSLEAVRLKYQALADASHGYGDLAVQATKDVMNGFNQLSGAMAGAIIDGKNVGDALIGVFKNIAKSILTDLIQAAMLPLKIALENMLSALLGLPPVGAAVATAVAGSMSGVNVAAGVAAGGLKALGAAATEAAASIKATGLAGGSGGSGGGAGGGALSTGGDIASIVTAGALIAADVLLGHISSDTGHIEVNTRETHAELLNVRTDLWSQFGQMYDRVGELKNDLDAIKDTLIQTAAAGGGIGPVALADLDAISVNTSVPRIGWPTMLGALSAISQDIVIWGGYIENDTGVMVQKLGQILTAMMTGQGSLDRMASDSGQIAADTAQTADNTGATADSTDQMASSMGDLATSSDLSSAAADITSAVGDGSDQASSATTDSMAAASTEITAAVGASAKDITSAVGDVATATMALQDSVGAVSTAVDSASTSATAVTAEGQARLDAANKAVQHALDDIADATARGDLQALQGANAELDVAKSQLAATVDTTNAVIAGARSDAAWIQQNINASLGAAQAASNTTEELKQLRNAYDSYEVLMKNAIEDASNAQSAVEAKGFLDTAEEYRIQANNVMAQIIQVQGDISGAASLINQGIVTETGKLGFQVTGAGTLAAAGAVAAGNQVTAAVNSAAVAIASAVSAASFKPTGGGTTTSTTAAPPYAGPNPAAGSTPAPAGGGGFSPGGQKNDTNSPANIPTTIVSGTYNQYDPNIPDPTKPKPPAAPVLDTTSPYSSYTPPAPAATVPAPKPQPVGTSGTPLPTDTGAASTTATATSSIAVSATKIAADQATLADLAKQIATATGDQKQLLAAQYQAMQHLIALEEQALSETTAQSVASAQLAADQASLQDALKQMGNSPDDDSLRQKTNDLTKQVSDDQAIVAATQAQVAQTMDSIAVATATVTTAAAAVSSAQKTPTTTSAPASASTPTSATPPSSSRGTLVYADPSNPLAVTMSGGSPSPTTPTKPAPAPTAPSSGAAVPTSPIIGGNFPGVGQAGEGGTTPGKTKGLPTLNGGPVHGPTVDIPLAAGTAIPTSPIIGGNFPGVGQPGEGKIPTSPVIGGNFPGVGQTGEGGESPVKTGTAIPTAIPTSPIIGGNFPGVGQTGEGKIPTSAVIGGNFPGVGQAGEGGATPGNKAPIPVTVVTTGGVAPPPVATGGTPTTGSTGISTASGQQVDPQTLGFYAGSLAELEDSRVQLHRIADVATSFRDGLVAIGKMLLTLTAKPGETATASFDTGGYVPHDMMAMVHAGEFVIPQDVTGMLRNIASTPSYGKLRQPDYGGADKSEGGAYHSYNITAPVTVITRGDPRQQAQQLVTHLKKMVPDAGAYSS